MSVASPDWIDIAYRAEKEHTGLRLDAFLHSRIKGHSRSEIQKWIDDGQVSLKGRPVKSASRVKAGESVSVRFARRIDPPATYESLPILYEDDHLLAINKPGRLLSHPTDKVRQNSATEILRVQLGGQPLFLAHRLDRETSGALILAKTREAARNLTDQFTKRAIHKDYLAIVAGEFSWARKTVDAPIARAEGEIKVRQGVLSSGSPAVTEFIRLAHSRDRSMVQASPKTGRLHQIRIHLAWLGHPLLGDKLYNGSGEAYLKAVRGEIADSDIQALGAPRQMLHAWKIHLRHPASNQRLTIQAPLPEDFMQALGSLQLTLPDK
jgi:23S rRNA pseudouridine1911/1915/1917 synthase